MKLFLDDERLPGDPAWKRDGWRIARSVDEFFQYMWYLRAEPEVTEMSFDHDLGHNQPTGFDAVKRLVEMEMDEPGLFKSLKRIILHTANRTGLENMEGYLRSAQANGILAEVEIVRMSVLENPGYARMP